MITSRQQRRAEERAGVRSFMGKKRRREMAHGKNKKMWRSVGRKMLLVELGYRTHKEQ